MFGMGMTEILVILGLALLVIGPKKLPELARTLGKGFKEFQKASDDLRQSFTSEYSFDEERRKLRKEFESLTDSVTDLPDEKTSAAASGEWQPPGTETAEERKAAAPEAPATEAAAPETFAGPAPEAETAGEAGETAAAEQGAGDEEKPAAVPETGKAAVASDTKSADIDKPPKSES